MPFNAFSANLWPLFQKDVHPFFGSEVDALGPIFHYEKDASHTGFGVRPLFYYERNRKGSRLDILYPLMSVKKGEGSSSSYVFPIWKGGSEKEKGDIWLFPFFKGREGDETFWGIFPIYGRIVGRFGWRSIEFFMWPLYTKEKKDDWSVDRFLWPLFSFYHGKASGFSFFPILGRYETCDGSSSAKTSFFLWPLFVERQRSSSGYNSTRRFLPFPIYSDYRRSDGLHGFSILWPFISYRGKPGEDGFLSLNAPWPIFKYREGYEGIEVKLFPLFKVKVQGSDTSSYVAWPSYHYNETHLRGGFVLKSHRFFLINRFSTLYGPDGEVIKRTFNLWPLFYYYRDGSYVENSSFTLFPTRNTGFERLYAPFFHVFTVRKRQGVSSYSFLWGFVKAGKRGFKKGVSVAWLLDFSWDSVSGDVKADLVKGFLGLERSCGVWKLRLAFIPIKF